jgi:hypothetical protein
MEIDVNTTSYLPQFYTDLFSSLLDRSKISYILIFGLVLFLFVGVFVFFGNATGGNTPIMLFIEVILWVVFLYVVVMNIQHMDYNFTTELKNLFSSDTTTLDVNVSKKDASDNDADDADDADASGCDTSDGEVFHIPNNKYSYIESREVCNKYSARLATYTEVEDSYKKGANWCSYGWSEDQLALFPTQKEIYNGLKLIPGHEHDCGRQGVNGGYIDNIHVKFGVNCFGKKPEKTDEDEAYMKRLSLSYSPAIDQDELDRISSEKNALLISPFNKDKWTIQ